MKFGTIFPFLKGGNSGHDILLTGIPRSGTTLACRLLCDFSQTIALNEPMDRTQFPNPHVAVENIQHHFKDFRKSLLLNGTARARTKEGNITDNAYSPDKTQREKVVERTEIKFTKNLNSDFTLIMKHCSEFTLLFPEILNHYPTFAIIRNPIAVLASWSTVDVPVSRGKVAKSERLNPVFHERLNQIGDDLKSRQLFILSWYFEQYKILPPEHIIKYEELTDTPAQSLNKLAKGETEGTLPTLQNKNTNRIYNKTEIAKLGEVLLQSEGHYWNYYSKESVKELLGKMMTDE